ncbi:MAG: CinA family protein [Fimbriimonadaceae bacterium]|nr:CinA family protein [Fimbriimonadaceae bacterium]
MNLSQDIANLLRERRQTLCVAESCTGGLVCAEITRTPGASEVFAGGIVCYQSQVKIDQLGVREEDIDQFSAVSSQVAIQMAEGACRLFGADLAIAITGVAGPGPDAQGNAEGLVFIAIAEPSGAHCAQYMIQEPSRELIRKAAVSYALGQLWNAIQS